MSGLNGAPAGPAGSGTPGLRRGCLMGMVILALLGSGIFYMIWKTMTIMTPPEELAGYAYRDSVMSQISNKAPAPPAGTQLTEKDVQFVIGGLEALNRGWGVFQSAYDSARADWNARGDSNEKFDPQDFDELGQHFLWVPLHERAALIDYLNSGNYSWEQYRWGKKRLLAASMITHQQMLDSVRAFMIRQKFEVDDEVNQEMAKPLFDEIESIRAAGVDSAEIAMVEPYRERLLTEWVHTLVDFEEAFFGDE